jgi:hypothetical protein
MSPDRKNSMHERAVRAPEDGRAAPASPAIVGYIDRIDGTRVSGWAWDRNQPDVPVDVEIRVGSQPVASVRADRLRKDLARSGTGNGYHAFEAVLNTPVADVERHLVGAVARVEGQPGSIALANRAIEPSAVPGPTAAAASPPPDMQRWLADLGAVRKAFEETLKVAAQDIREAVRGRALTTPADATADGLVPSATLEELRTRQEEMARQLAAFEVFHARFDTALRALERPQVELKEQGDSGKGLRIAVVIVGMLSVLSLTVGLWSVLM